MTREHESNRLAWNEAAEFYRKGLESSIALLKRGGMTFHAPELKILESLKSKLGHCVHLQCAGGADTLSLINLGAKSVTGVDISEEMTHIAQTKSDALRMNATWVTSDILNVPASLSGTADLVYTGKGAICWMMDIAAWAKIVAKILKPGGVLFLFEGHPFTYFFDMKAAELKIDVDHKGYFSADAYVSQDWPETYVGKLKDSTDDQAVKYEKAWPVSAVINALIGAGLVLERFEEYPDKYWNEFQNLPDDLRMGFPNTYSVVARKPMGPGDAK